MDPHSQSMPASGGRGVRLLTGLLVWSPGIGHTMQVVWLL